MNINLENNKYEFGEFIGNNNVLQGEFEVKTITKSYENLFLHKLKEKNGAYSIFFMSYFKDCKLTSDFNKYEFLLSIDKENKMIIYQSCFYIFNLKEKLKKDFSDYQIWEVEELAKQINNEYKTKLYKMFDINTENFKSKFSEYKKQYNKVLKEYKSVVERDYIIDKSDYKLYINDLGEYSYYELENLQNYLKNPRILDSLVQDCFKEKTKDCMYNSTLYNHAEIQAKKKLLKDIKENPSDYVKTYMEIKTNIKGIGKTLNIITKDDKKIKVNNRLYEDGFRTVKGYDEIRIEDIAKITYGKKILFSI